MNWKQFIYRYKHIFVALYFPVYMVWFVWLEARVDVPFTYIHCAIDDYIPLLFHIYYGLCMYLQH